MKVKELITELLDCAMDDEVFISIDGENRQKLEIVYEINSWSNSSVCLEPRIYKDKQNDN